MSYVVDLMSGGIAVSKKQIYGKFSRYQYPEVIKNLGRTKVARKKEKEELLELAEELHCSTKKVKKYYLPFLDLQNSKN